ncbi:helix-turn-helix transcriptional regulator [Hymenobacter sp. BT190]|uniref:helix-turn-helix transcriptional regulator n=1 Tax=Hymenobacter sp. BT190 TaxID=2763505 RepID=UPI0016511202|nr:helix-turn-helix transcriptional regulator [Hymenobacter sp. BT190]MBC6698727.1 helix-turn-helix transcriptional regulator [Hymenobacter sp. BT190]
MGNMVNNTTVGQRFVQLISHLGISKNAFANSLDKTATVVQHLVEERNKPGFDLLCKVFEVYPNVSKDWLIEGVGPMLVSSPIAPTTPPAAAAVAAGSVETAQALPPAVAPVATEAELEPAKPEAAASQPALVSAPTSQRTPVAEAPIEIPAMPAPAPAPAVVSAPTAPVVAAAPAPDAAWQTALYTQQMAHQLAMAELRNQHLQDQQRLMQQMLDLMQRRM